MRTDRISPATLIAFGAPAVGAGYMYLLLALYVMKFSTDVLLIAPAVMGLIFSVSRIWDAISDPLVGYLSDRTGLSLGRRRTWILVSLVPIAIGFYAVFAPPQGLSVDALSWWMAAAVIGFYSAMTLFFVPHMALGAELSNDYHERSRLFGLRHAFYTFGSILSLATMQLLINEEFSDGGDVRAMAEQYALYAVVAMSVLVLYAVVNLRERPEFQGRLDSSPVSAFRDVWQNPHARLLVIVTFIENIGSSAIAVLTLYVTQYVVGAPLWAPLIILAYMLPSTASVPLWLPLSRRFGKIRVWIFGMALYGVAFGGMFFLPFLDTVDARLVLIIAMAAFAGFAAGCGGTIGPSVQGDVIDYDEYKTGERKEGSYFAVWNFTYKSALGVMLLLTGFVLEASGFIPNQPQPMSVQIAMVTLYGALPLVCYVIGAVLFSRFKLNEQEYVVIRAELDRRATAAS
ncbi:MAG TPA: hypothetical protein DHU16_04875 [Gammaproteobacteria bacterium]|nr:hypothetical protein [Gammaproteobacteria bacterium]